MDWLPFDLHPEYPPEGIPRAALDARYGEEFQGRVREMVEAAGIPYNPPPNVVPKSQKALQVTELARDHGLHEPVHSRLMQAYWSEAADIGDEDILLGLAAEAGLGRAEAEKALAEGRYAARVQASTQQAHQHGINAIPAFVLGERLLLLGAQPEEFFERAVAQLGSTG